MDVPWNVVSHGGKCIVSWINFVGNVVLDKKKYLKNNE